MLKTLKTGLYAAASAATLALALNAPAQAIPFRDDVGDEGAQAFAAPWDGVIQIFMWNRSTGAISFNCTGSMINPRTVLSAAHCFNSQPNAVYGANGPLTPIIAFGPDTFVPLFNWIDTGRQFMDERNGLTFALDVRTPGQGSFGGDPFPVADVAMLTLLDPLFTLPTYGMLFSPIPDDVLSDGVHVNMIGYGTFNPGSSTAGATINGRRRAGENMLGFMGNFRHFFQTLSQDPSTSFNNPAENQMLYWVDFTNPDPQGECARGAAFGFTNSVICTDWDGVSGGIAGGDTVVLPGPSLNLFPGEALPNEVGTAGGDSGGPLMAMNIFSNPLILGVLSGGFVEGFLHTSGQSYGKLSYYNPLFAWHEFIAENNPYKYVTNTGGGDWFDASIWQQVMDPNYYIYEDGEIVNGLPGTPQPGTDPTDPWGIVFDTDVQDLLGSGTTSSPDDAAVGETAADAADMAADGLVAVHQGGVRGQDQDGAARAGWVEDGSVESFGGNTPDAANHGALDEVVGGAAAPANSGPGSTGFAPSNSYAGDGSARFYDVTLAAPGTVTFGGALIEIDRLTLAGPDAGLVIEEDGILWSLIGTELFAGSLQVDGDLITRELVMWGGMLSGSGFVDLFDPNLLFGNSESVAGALFNVAGVINPGVADSAGSLGMFGDYIQTAAGAFLIDWTATSASRLDVFGSISLDGGFAVNPAAGYLPRFGDRRRIITFSGDRVGEFAGSLNDLPGVLFFAPVYGAGWVDLEIRAEDFASFTAFDTPAQFSLAQRFDQMRASQSAGAGPLSGLYDVIDLLPAGPLGEAFENLVPHESWHLRRTAALHGDLVTGALRQRMAQRPGATGSGGAQALFSLLGSENGRAMDGASLAAAARQAGGDPVVHDAGEGREVYFAAGVIDGSARTSAAAARAGIDGAFALAGADMTMDNGLRVGAAVAIANSESDQALPGGGASNTRTDTIQTTGYAALRRNNFIGQASVSWAGHEARSRRSAAVGGLVLPVSGTLSGRTLEASLTGAYQFTQDAFWATPSASLTASQTRLSGERLDGSPLATLTLEGETYSRHVARAGIDVGYRFDGGDVSLEPRAYLGYAMLLNDTGETLSADFTSAPGASPILFDTGARQDANWLELSVGAAAVFANGMEVSLQYATRERSNLNLESDVFTVGLAFRF
ncbi:MAG: autotransporter domain-containing protein [Oceanicaulis sp.]|nr:autotransporter domain-containing protein [Oceanicaulis sp.]